MEKRTMKYINYLQVKDFKRKLKPLTRRYKKTSNTLYLKQLDEITRRISRNKTYTLGTGQKI